MRDYYNNYFDDDNNDLFEPSKRSRNFKVNIDESSLDGDYEENLQDDSEYGTQFDGYGSTPYVSDNYDEYSVVDVQFDNGRKNAAVKTYDGDVYELSSSGYLDKGTYSKSSSRDKGCLSAFIYAICVCLFSAVFSYWFIVGCNDMFALKKDASEVVVQVPKNSDLNDIADLLKENGIIKYKTIFKFYAHISGDDEGFKHGDFVLNTKTDYSQLIRKLTNPASSDGSTVKVVFPEGLNVEQYGELLEENNVCTKEAFVERMTSTVYDFWFLEGVYPSTNDETGTLNMEETEKIYLLEGYLFPDTYDFYINEGSKSAINRMLTNFNSKIDDELKAQIKSSKYSADQIITIASIIERETNVPEEMPKIASVIFNRLKSSKFDYIQSDATKTYPYATASDIPEKLRDGFVGKYDTYQIKGLPAGAICNPGLNAIKAAVNPADTDYFYFYMDKNGKHYYSKTLKEHEAVIEQCKKAGIAF